MTSVNIALPILQCTSCNKYIGHMIKDYKKFTKELITLLDNNHNFETDDYKMITTESPGRDIYKIFVKPYFLYADKKDKELFDIKVLIIYALLTKKELTEHDFPFRSIVKDKYRYCCTRMLLCDFSKSL